jgi:predicted dehydrogenase
MGKNKSTTRRDFIKLAGTTALVAGAPRGTLAARHTLEPQQPQQPSVSPNDKIQIALIGAGGMGFGDTQTALRVPGTELVAAADVYDGRLTRVKEVWGNHIFTTRDYKEVLARPDVDAVIIATPDHWHSQIAIDAMNAGKDVYCEKPMVQLVEEGHPVIEAERKTKRIVQVGSQRVSNIAYHKAKELLASGSIGELNLIEAWINRRFAIGAWQYSIPPDASTETIDWERFLGRAPKRPFDPVRLFRWRNYRDYGTGIGGDLFVHLFSGIHLIVGSNGPSRVMTTGGLRYWNDGRDVPDVLLGLYDYPKATNAPAFNIALRVNFADGSVSPNQFESSGFRFIGSEGVMMIEGDSVTISRSPRPKEPGFTIGTFPKAVQDAFIKEYRAKYPEERAQVAPSGAETWSAPPGYNDRLDHFRNFFEGVRERKPVVEDSAFGFRAAGPALLSNVSYFENRICEWDPEAIKLKK